MLAHEVPLAEQRVANKLQRRQIETHEASGPWSIVVSHVHADDKDASALHQPLEATLERFERDAPGGQFSAVLTTGCSSVALGRVRGAYYVFDSHNNAPAVDKATLLKYASLGDMCTSLRRRLGVAVSSQLLGASGERERLENSTYALYVMHKKVDEEAEPAAAAAAKEE